MLWLGIAALVYVGVLLWIAWRSLHPFRIPIFLSPGVFGAPQENVEFQTEEGHWLRGWWVQGSHHDKAVLVFCHGYMMNRAELAAVAYAFWQRGRSSLLFDFRCMGRSGGTRSGLGWYERCDVAAACAYVRHRMPGAKVVLVGSSMGSAASAFAMADDPDLAEALVLDSCYGSLPSAVQGWWRFLGGRLLALLLGPSVLIAAPLAGFNPFRTKVSRALARVERPVLVLHGTADDLALPREARSNHAALSDSPEIVWFERCGHTEGRWVQPDRYLNSIETFLEERGL